MIEVLISGYYGFDNFGDDAILHVLVSELKKKFRSPGITVISNNPKKTEKIYGVDSVYRFNLPGITKKMEICNFFISGGGSLLQDVTSFRSFLYYLGLIHMANSRDKKTIIYGQGIGPISTIFARFLTRNVLLKTALTAVRDRESRDFLKQLRVDSVLVTDPVWHFKSLDGNNFFNNDKINIGVQLREWKTFSNKALNTVAEAVEEKFNDEKYCINLIVLQDTQDIKIMQNLKNIFLKKKLKSKIRIYSTSYLSIPQSLSMFGSLDYLIGMRYHACLVAINFNVPTLALSYDPKVKHLAIESKIPCINIDSLRKGKNKSVLLNKINELISNTEEIKKELEEFSCRKNMLCKDNLDLLMDTLSK